jgi:hypothetical protein
MGPATPDDIIDTGEISIGESKALEVLYLPRRPSQNSKEKNSFLFFFLFLILQIRKSGDLSRGPLLAAILH